MVRIDPEPYDGKAVCAAKLDGLAPGAVVVINTENVMLRWNWSPPRPVTVAVQIGGNHRLGISPVANARGALKLVVWRQGDGVEAPR